VNRATRLFLAALVCAAAMLGAGRSIRPGIDSAGVTLGMIRFLLMMGGAVAAVAVWATALLAALQRVMWPLAVAVATLAGSALAFAFS
jgi:hypothetical protein